jgi:hypothetical protein
MFAIELGDDELRPLLLTGRERCRQLRPVAVLAALNLGKFTDQLPAKLRDVA